MEGAGDGLDVRAAALSGLAIGVVGGVVGLILGSLRMPALLRWVGETPQKAVGTNVTVGVFVGVAGALAHLPNAAPDLDVVARRWRRVGPRGAARLAPHRPAVGPRSRARDRGRPAGGRGGLPRAGRNLTPMGLQEETADVLGRLIRFNTVNPPGEERACQEYLRDYLTEAGFECELIGAEDERPNLVATLRGDEAGPVLGYLSHVDTVLASPEDWSRDPWSGELHDGHVWGRGALDMKSQTAAEVVAGAALAREGWRPARGELKIMSVVDEEVGGLLGAQWLTQQHPDLVRCDYLLNEGAGPVIPYGDRRLFGVCCAEKGTFRFAVRTTGRAGHASVPALADNALLKLAPLVTRLGDGRAGFDLTDEPRAFMAALGLDPDDPEGALRSIAEVDDRLAKMVEPTMGVTFAPTIIAASQKINVIPARAELKVDCRVPPGMGAEETMARVREVLGADDGFEVEFLEEVIGNRSPLESPLMDAIRDWVGEQEPEAEVVPVALPAFTDSRWYRDAFPDCIAYGFFPQRHQSLYETWPLIHGADERIDVRDLGFAASFFHELPRRLLA